MSSETPAAAGDDGEATVAPRPGARRRSVVLLLGLAIAGGALVWWATGWLESRLTDVSVPIEERRALARQAVLLMAMLAAAVALGAAAYCGALAQRVRATDRYPPPGLAVLRATTVRRGSAAQRVATALFAVAGALVLACVALAVAASRLLAILAG